MKPVFHPPFLLLQEDSYSITPKRTSIWIVTLPKIWFIFRQNGCQTQNYIEAWQMLCFPKDPPSRVLSAHGRVITRKGGWRNGLTSSPQRLILQNGIIRSLRCRSSSCKLLLFPVPEFISWIWGGWGVGGGAEKWQGKRLSLWEECLRIGKLLLVLPALHGLREVNVKFHSK